MTKTPLAWITGLVLAALFATSAAAHHSPAAFDRTREVQVEGTLTKLAYGNPHIYLTVETTGRDGRRVLQEIEAGPISTVQPLGLMRDSVKVGEHVVVRASPNRRGDGYTVLGLDITRADGKTFPLNISSRSVFPASTALATSLAGTWRPTLKGFEGLAVAIATSWPLTDEGRRRLAEAREANFTTQAECVPAGAPMLMVYPVVTNVQIDDAAAVFDIDWLEAKRVVHLDTASHPPDLQPSLQGHSIGRWENGTLVVETTGFLPHDEGLGFAMPSSEGKRLVERFTLGDDRRHLVYDVTVEDPRYLSGTVAHQALWEYSPDLRPSGVACDVEVARRYLQEGSDLVQTAIAPAQTTGGWPGRALTVALIVFGTLAAWIAIRVRRRTTGQTTRTQ